MSVVVVGSFVQDLALRLKQKPFPLQVKRELGHLYPALVAKDLTKPSPVLVKK